jgi:rubrerythrin
MHLTAPFPLLRRGRPRPAPVAARHAHVHAAAQPKRRSTAVQDRALYHCECGYHWTGEVTASPGCPHCGTPQAW